MRIGLATSVAVAIIFGTVLLQGGGGEPAPPGVANIWLDTNGGTCADSSSLVAYVDADACATLSAAVTAAEAGDVIRIKGGTYPSDSTPYVAALKDLSPACDPHGAWGSVSTTNCVQIIADEENVIFRALSLKTSSLWLQGADVGNSCSSHSVCAARQSDYTFHVTNTDLIGNPPAGADDDALCNCQSANFEVATENSDLAKQVDHVTVDNVDSDTFAVLTSHHVYSLNADIGPLWVDTPNRGSASGSGPGVPKARGAGVADIVWNGTFFHEINRTFWCDVNNACHPDGLFIDSGGPFTIQNSGMTQVAAQGFFIENFGGGPDVHDVLIENSWFGCLAPSYVDDVANYLTSCGGFAGAFEIKNCGTTCEDFLIRFNAIQGYSGAETSYTNVRFVGNVMEEPAATEGLCTQPTWKYNAFWRRGFNRCTTVYEGTNVDSGGTTSTVYWTNIAPATTNLHLTGSPGSTGADNVVPTSQADSDLATDADEQSRPIDTNRDSGIDER